MILFNPIFNKKNSNIGGFNKMNFKTNFVKEKKTSNKYKLTKFYLFSYALTSLIYTTKYILTNLNMVVLSC